MNKMFVATKGEEVWMQSSVGPGGTKFLLKTAVNMHPGGS